MKLLVVGQAPARGRTGRRAFEPDTPSGARLAKLMGVEDVVEVADVVNLVRRFPGDSPWNKGHRFPEGQAKRAARRLRLNGYDVVLLTGRHVARAFDVDVEFLRWFELRGVRAVVLPHPSGANLWWNKRANRARAERLLRRICA